MKNELQVFKNYYVEALPGAVIFENYEELKEEALSLSDALKTVEVNEETIKASKKLLAAVNNKVHEMEQERIGIKKALLQPYEEYEKQVKEIVKIVKDADSIVRNQVRELEELERQEKKEQLEKIWKMRLKHYPHIAEYWQFSEFIKPQHLNKSVSIDKTEMDMLKYLQGINSDIEVINTMDNKEELLQEYLDTKDLNTAILIVAKRHEIKEKPEIKSEEKVKLQQIYTFTVFNEEDQEALETWLNKNKIKHKKEVK